ncbi:hypothetical protein EJ05DRAFT_471530 [Pseudovirgaria hyperparasitica]|uniref:Uncharacterized protein n=1 Tax=Pseudovirgaria hyperparasitica TaxID=470096 RepID=A0A6A6WIB4_9PEZI|nr:uncharacterized protein EJ05DRAFT_471530 [Pseudovirgaria hyperparasitica]KAF2762528.1 hypothetical protein EJ05DRAFT_471530 [Pseudovirgaria hyperparasitica]
MPRATRSSGLSAAAKTKPYSKPSQSKQKASHKSQGGKKDASQTDEKKEEEPSTIKKPTPKAKDPKASHLYTDDNPSTTIHGTGFKDAAKAHETISLVSKRSLLYQYQTINTMYHRATHHPHISTSSDMKAAQKVFREWLDVTYPSAKDSEPTFPLLKKDVVEAYLPLIEDLADEEALVWAEKYAGLAKGKKLANVLMDESVPAERDMAIVRQGVLEGIMKEKNRGRLPERKDVEFLWQTDQPASGLSESHLRCVAYGWSPCTTDVLMKALNDGEKSA